MQTHEQLERQHEVAVSSERGFGLVFAGFLGIVGAVRLWHGLGDAPWWFGGAAVFASLALFWTAPLAPLNRQWARLGRFLHAIVNPVLMGIVFALAIVPTGLALRLAGKDLLRLRRDPAAGTYWVPCSGSANRADGMKDQF
ncbi:MAG TPA: hypothetical protein VFX72_00895 [Usitatibacteraceae bacterium]|nr:hypothetical protein [Usitatibacteraceae bacterium]